MNRMMSSTSGLIPPPRDAAGRRAGVGTIGAASDVSSANAELLREALRHAQRDQLEPRAVVALPEGGRRLAADLARRRVGDEPFGALPRLDAAVSLAVGRRLLRHEEDDDAGVARAVADGRQVADLPLATDAERDLARLAPAEVRQRDDGDLALRLVAHVLRDALDARRRRRLESRWRSR